MFLNTEPQGTRWLLSKLVLLLLGSSAASEDISVFDRFILHKLLMPSSQLKPQKGKFISFPSSVAPNFHYFIVLSSAELIDYMVVVKTHGV